MAKDVGTRVFNANYPDHLPLTVLKAGDLCQLPELNDKVTYQAIRDRLPELPFLTDPTRFPKSAAFPTAANR
jgi:hypothetical protein